jgi:hypothetical protein
LGKNVKKIFNLQNLEFFLPIFGGYLNLLKSGCIRKYGSEQRQEVSFRADASTSSLASMKE